MSNRKKRSRYKLKGTPMERLDKAFMKAYRAEAVARQNHECIYCYERLTPHTATADHIKPRSKGGGNGRDNIDALCPPCNSQKGSMTKAEFMLMISRFPTGKRLSIQMAWARRKLNLQIKRSERRLYKAFGWIHPSEHLSQHR